MRVKFLLLSLACSVLTMPMSLTAQATDHLNPLIPLFEKGLPVFGIAHPEILPRGGGGGRRGGAAGADASAAAPRPAPVPADVARETVAYTRADYLNTSRTSETFLRYIAEIRAAGGSVRTHPFAAKIPIWPRDPEAANLALIRQLNAGHIGVMMQRVESAQEVRDVIKAVRFASAGGTRPDTGLAAAAAYWGLTVDQYRQKADVWPLNRNGELLVTVIIESREGLAKVREIAAEPGVGAIWAGYGTLGQVFAGDPDGRETAAQQILEACKEFKVPCGFPTDNPAQVERRIGEGWSVFVMQSRNEAAFAAIEAGRKISQR